MKTRRGGCKQPSKRAGPSSGKQQLRERVETPSLQQKALPTVQAARRQSHGSLKAHAGSLGREKPCRALAGRHPLIPHRLHQKGFPISPFSRSPKSQSHKLGDTSTFLSSMKNTSSFLQSTWKVGFFVLWSFSLQWIDRNQSLAYGKHSSTTVHP